MSHKNTYQPAYYGDYLKLDQLLSAQVLRSEEPGETPAHDEMLFIVIHLPYLLLQVAICCYSRLFETPIGGNLT